MCTFLFLSSFTFSASTLLICSILTVSPPLWGAPLVELRWMGVQAPLVELRWMGVQAPLVELRWMGGPLVELRWMGVQAPLVELRWMGVQAPLVELRLIGEKVDLGGSYLLPISSRATWQKSNKRTYYTLARGIHHEIYRNAGNKKTLRSPAGFL
uniref:Uncharacterized protein n=1 Tax=Xenopus tropicalis TaxID=8364 RepID=A0A803K8Z0_XENTR